jgi:hypothetical protein
VLRRMLDRHLHLDHELVVVTDDARGFDGDIRVVPLPTTYAHTPRCRRRMQIFSRDFAREIGTRILSIDLDVVIVDDITPIVNRLEPIVCWRVNHAQVFSGSFHLMNAGELDSLWLAFAADPEGFPRSIQRNGIPSDQAMLNAYLRGRDVPYWTEADGFVTFYGAGYERLEHLGVGPRRRELPPGARIIVLGSADLAVLSDPSYPFVKRHWLPLTVAAERRAS